MDEAVGVSGGAPSVSCEDCAALIARFVEGGMRAADRARLKDHVADCSGCAEAYAGALRSAAVVGRNQRERRLSERARVRRETHREMALSATGSRPRGSLHRLRLVLLPALFALLVVMINRSPRGTEVVWEAGTVEAAGRALTEDEPSVRIGKGTWCSTGERSSARVASLGAVLRLGSRTSVRVEPPTDRARVRLHSGNLVVDGAASVSTPLGVYLFEEDAAGRLVWRGDELEVHCDRGAVVWTGPRGEQRIAAGSQRTFSLSAGAPQGEP